MDIRDRIYQTAITNGLPEERARELAEKVQQLYQKIQEEGDEVDMEWYKSLPPVPKEGMTFVTTWKRKPNRSQD